MAETEKGAKLDTGTSGVHEDPTSTKTSERSKTASLPVFICLHNMGSQST